MCGQADHVHLGVAAAERRCLASIGQGSHRGDLSNWLSNDSGRQGHAQ
jgi:hypothetical protein